MTAPNVDTEQQVVFQIVSQSYDSWNVQFRIEVSELVDQQSLLRHLRSIKQKIAEAQKLNETFLVFDEMVSKTRSDDFVDVVVRIKKVEFEKGNPSVTLKDGIALDGTRYSRMTALLDICYLDLFERIITLERVMNVVKESGVAADMIDKDAIAQKVQDVVNSHTPLKALPVAQGVFPDLGRDAELEFYFHALPDPKSLDSYYSSRKVAQGDLLCRKVPSAPGPNAGRNVLGEELPPRAGLDFPLKAESGTELSFDGNEIKAVIDGVVVVQRTMQKIQLPHGTKEIPQLVSVKVNPVLTVKGDQVLDIATSQTVEVIGNLQIGSRILTDCEVHVTGDVEEGTLIQAADDITIDGQVRSAAINSESNVILQKDVSGSSVVSARGGVYVHGAAKNSRLVGTTVSADSVSGCSILARNSVNIGRVDADENNLLSTICVGMTDFFEQRLHENEDFLQKARANMTRISILLGHDIVEEVTAVNVQAMLLRFLAKSRAGQDANCRRQIDVYRKLLESVPPSRTLIQQKERENIELKQRIAEHTEKDQNMIIVREKIAAPVAISMDGAETQLSPTDGPTTIRTDTGGKIVTESAPLME